MTQSEYATALTAIHIKQQKAIESLAWDYVLQNNVVSVGDKVTDTHRTIIVQSMHPEHTLYRFPTMSYYGEQLSEAGKVHAVKTMSTVYGCNIVKINERDR